MCFRSLIFLSSPLLLDFLHLLSLDESDLLDDESDYNGSESLEFYESIVSVIGLWSGVFMSQ